MSEHEGETHVGDAGGSPPVEPTPVPEVPPETTTTPPAEEKPAEAAPPASEIKYEMSPVGPSDSVSYPSDGPVLNAMGQPVTNDHSILTKIANSEVWLHHAHHHHEGGRVHMPIWAARDAGLKTPIETVPPAEPVEASTGMIAGGVQEAKPAEATSAA